MDTNEVDWETYCFTEFDEGQTRRVMDGEEQVLCGTRSSWRGFVGNLIWCRYNPKRNMVFWRTTRRWRIFNKKGRVGV